MKLIFICHGETREGKKGIILGSRDGHLTAQGKQEAKNIAHELIERRIVPDIIIASPLARALDTARIIAHILKCDIMIDKITRERAAGIAEGKKESDIDWKMYEKRPIKQRKHKGGESFLNVYKRAEKFIQKLKGKYKTKTVLVVSHSVFILMYLAFIKHKSIEYILKNKQKDKILIIKTQQ
jgi:broad specificity phosphatase PhoE